MKATDTGKNKIQKICDIIKTETIEPAQQEAREIIENAHLKAEEITHGAQKEAKEIIAKAENASEKQKKVFESSLAIAARQSVDSLRQKIEQEMFNQNLSELSKKALSETEAIAKIINAIIEGIEKQGIDSDLSVYVGKAVSAKEVSHMLLKKIIERLREKDILLGDFPAGIKVRLHDLRVTIDLSDEALKELLSTFVHKDFREMIFKL